MSHAQDCIENLLKDLEKIQPFISKGDYVNAAEKWKLAMFERQFIIQKEKINNETHCGSSFVQAVEMLKDALYKKDNTQVKNAYNFVKIYGAQFKLPNRD